MSTPINDECKVEITNRSKTYRVSKKLLCSSIPYFEKMFCCDLLESQSSKVKVDHDEDAFRNILDYVYNDHLMLTLDIVLPTLHVADYLMMDNLLDKCTNFFLENFTCDKLPNVLKSISSVTNVPYQFKLINKRTIDFFIKRYFFKIANTQAFLNYPVETIEYICKLDLIIDSEYQVFDAITRWIKFKEDRRIKFTDNLMKCIHWCHLDVKELNKARTFFTCQVDVDIDKLVEESENLNQKNCNRIISKSLVAIYQLHENVIQLRVYKNPKLWTTCGEFTLNIDLSSNLITNENIIDIIYDCGRRGIRLDCESKKFNYLIMFGDESSYYGRIFKYIEDPPYNIKDKFIALKSNSMETIVYKNLPGADMIIDSGEHYSAISRYTLKKANKRSQDAILETFLVYESPIKNQSLFANLPGIQSSTACLIKDTIYKVDESLEFRRFNLTHEKVRTLKFVKDKRISFEYLELFNHNGELILCDKQAKKAYKYNAVKDDWQTFFEIITDKRLITMVSTHLLNSYPQRNI